VTKKEFAQLDGLFKKLKDHVRAADIRAEWFKTQFYNNLKEQRKAKGGAE
jgi:hypothetical protein